jgi:hypothetical protein
MLVIFPKNYTNIQKKYRLRTNRHIIFRENALKYFIICVETQCLHLTGADLQLRVFGIFICFCHSDLINQSNFHNPFLGSFYRNTKAGFPPQKRTIIAIINSSNSIAKRRFAVL